MAQVMWKAFPFVESACLSGPLLALSWVGIVGELSKVWWGGGERRLGARLKSE